MIQQLVGRITEDELSEIKEIILEQEKKYSRFMQDTERQELFVDEYKSHQKAFSISWAVYSGFRDGKKIGSLNVFAYRYGKKHVRPELENDRITLHVMNSSMDPDAEYLKRFYEMNDDNFENEMLYAYIKFSTMKKYDIITNIEVCIPDKNGKIIKKETIYQKPKLKVLGA